VGTSPRLWTVGGAGWLDDVRVLMEVERHTEQQLEAEVNLSDERAVGPSAYITHSTWDHALDVVETDRVVRVKEFTLFRGEQMMPHCATAMSLLATLCSCTPPAVMSVHGGGGSTFQNRSDPTPSGSCSALAVQRRGEPRSCNDALDSLRRHA
jgi:hypothetical protein